MSDQNTDTSNASQTTTDTASGSETGGNAPKKVADLPQWAQDELSRARNDAATYRTKLRDTEQALNDSKTELQTVNDKAAELEVKVGELELNGLKLDAALDVLIPDGQVKAFADRLRGNTLDDLKADAEAVTKLYNVQASGGRATDRTAGLGANQPKPTPESAFGNFVKSRLSRGN